METGIKGYAETMVDSTNIASAADSVLPAVFSTPHMIALIEKAAHESVTPYLEEGQGTVGTRLEVDHLAATPVGQKVWAETELVEIEGRILTFKVSAFSNVEKIGEGVHKRCIILKDRFVEKTNERYTSRLIQTD